MKKSASILGVLLLICFLFSFDEKNETRTKVNAIKKMLNNSVAESAFLSIAFIHDAGKVISKRPKNESEKTTNKKKNNKLNTALVAKLFNELAPKRAVTNNPNPK